MIINNKRHSINSLARTFESNCNFERKSAFWFAKLAVKANKRVV